MNNMVKTPSKWTVENRFWLNSKYMCTRLGLNNFKDRKSTKSDQNKPSLENCIMTESENPMNEAKMRRKFEEKSRKENHVIFGNLQNPKDTLSGALNLSEPVIENLTLLLDRPLDTITQDGDRTISTLNDNSSRSGLEKFITKNELVAQSEMTSILEDCLGKDTQIRANHLNSMELSNKDWKQFKY